MEKMCLPSGLTLARVSEVCSQTHGLATGGYYRKEVDNGQCSSSVSDSCGSLVVGPAGQDFAACRDLL